MLSGVVIQGGKHRDRNVFMKRFKVGHSLDGDNWTVIKEDNTTKPKVGSLLQNFCFQATAILFFNHKQTPVVHFFTCPLSSVLESEQLVLLDRLVFFNYVQQL